MPVDYSSATSWKTRYDDYIAEKTADLNAEIYEALKVPTTSPDYRGSELPSGYTQVEYLESSGTQWIETNYLPSINSRFVAKFAFTKNIGSVFGEVSSPYIFLNANGSNIRVQFGNGGTEVNNAHSLTVGEKYDIDISYERYIINGSEVSGNKTYTGTPPSIKLFSRGNDNGYVQIYSFMIYDNLTLVRDFIPCYDSNHVFGLYDVADHTGQSGYDNYTPFYTNQGTGTFNASIIYTHSLQGSGTENDPYLIQDEYDFYYIRNKTNGYYFKLTNDIYLNDGKFVENEDTGAVEYFSRKSENDGIYIWPGEQWAYLFTWSNCVFDGQGYAIYGMYGRCTFNATLSNCKMFDFHFKNCYSYTDNTHGIICQTANNCKFENCTTDGWVGGTYGCSGLIFQATNSSFINCVNRAHNISTGGWNPAGIVGRVTDCTIKDCKNYGNNNQNWAYAGIVGQISGETYVSGCYNEGNIAQGNGIAYSGGTIFENCVNKGNCGGSGIGGGGTKRNCTNYGSCANGIGGGSLIENCENYGECSYGIGSAALIKGCKNYKLKNSGQVYGIGYSESSTVENCVNYANCENAAAYFGIGRLKSIKNCVNYGNGTCNGWANGYEAICGIGIAEKIENCTNYGKMSTVISGRGVLAGIYVGLYGSAKNVSIINCVNRGKISADVSSARAAGIAVKTHGNCCEQLYVINCHNYGDITVNTNIGGIVCIGGEKYTQIVNCNNYGNIKSTSSAGGVAYTISKGDIIGCVNYGNLLSTGTEYKGGILYEGSAQIDNCINYGIVETIGANGWCGGIVCRSAKKISNCINYGKVISKAGGTLKAGIAGAGASEGIYNCINYGELLTYNNQTNGITGSGVNSKVIVNCINKSLINGEMIKSYYGSDFSAFFVKWKTGYIGLKALESAGVYMFAIPDEEYLQQIGYTKAG